MGIELKAATKRSNKKAITFVSGERKFTFKPPKTAAIVDSVTESGGAWIKAQLEWLYGGLSEKDVKHLKERINDLNDPLDIDDLIGLVRELLDEVSGRPTESSSSS